MKTRLKKIKKAIKWLFSEKGKRLSKKEEFRYKCLIRTYFEGDRYSLPVSSNAVSVITLGVTEFKFRRFKDHDVIIITLERPGLLVGRGGRVIDSLTEHLEKLYERKIIIKLFESKVWKNQS